MAVCRECGDVQSQGQGCPPDVSSFIPGYAMGQAPEQGWAFFGGGLLLPVFCLKAQESGTEYKWLLLGIFLPKHIGFKDISRRSGWISGHSDHGPHGAEGNEGKLQTIQAECRKRQTVKWDIERYSPGGCWMSEAYSRAALTCVQSSRGFMWAITTAAAATHCNPENTLEM